MPLWVRVLLPRDPRSLEDILEPHKELIAEYMLAIENFARVPRYDEFPRINEIKKLIGGPKKSLAVLEKIYDAYSFNLIPKFGSWFAGDEDSYQYLAESIRKHPDQETLKQMIIDAGFDMCEYQNLTGGVVAIHKGIKI